MCEVRFTLDSSRRYGCAARTIVRGTASLLRRFVTLRSHDVQSHLIPYSPQQRSEKMHEKILHNPVILGDEISPSACQILARLLDQDPSQRLGVNGTGKIKRHPFFAQHTGFWGFLQERFSRTSSQALAVQRMYRISHRYLCDIRRSTGPLIGASKGCSLFRTANYAHCNDNQHNIRSKIGMVCDRHARERERNG